MKARQKPVKSPSKGRPKSENPLKKRMIRATDDQWERWVRAGGENVSLWIRESLDSAAHKKGIR